MNGSFPVILTAVFPVMAIVGLGLLLRRTGVLNAQADKSILRVVINVLIPCLIWDSILGNPALEEAQNAWIPPLVGFSSVMAGFLVAHLVAGFAGFGTTDRKRTFTLTTGLYNWAYLALPLCVFLFGKETVGVLFVHNLGVEVALWTVGFMILTGQSPRHGWKRIINGPVIAICTALLANFCHAEDWLPAFILKTIAMLGASAIPIGLLLVGVTFWDHMGEVALLRNFKVGAIAVLIRLGFLPLCFLGAAFVLPVSSELKQVMVIQAAMPSAVFPVILAKHYGGHEATALRIVLWTTLVSILTMPLWIHFGLTWLELDSILAP